MDLSVFDLRRAAALSAQEDISDILTGLAAEQKTLPTRLFYDDAGCALFNQITELAEYTVTRAEMALLARYAADIVSTVSPGSVLVEYGASDESKAARLLGADRFAGYVPIDIAGLVLVSLRERMRRSHPDLIVEPVQADFTGPVRLPQVCKDRALVGFFPGSTIGNFEPDMVVRFLRQVRSDLARGIGGDALRFIVGTDLRKEPALLIPAYDDAQGVTAAFNRNILDHVNRIADGGFDPRLFAHEARWNDAQSRIEMHLVSRLEQTVLVAGQPIGFLAGESIHTENSYKHTPEGFLALARRAGWEANGFWTDPEGRFGTHRLMAA